MDTSISKKKDINIHPELVNSVKNSEGNGIIIGTYLDATIPYLIEKKCVTLGNYKGHEMYLENTLKDVKDHCESHNHKIDFCIMKNDQNFTHVMKLSTKYFGTSQFTVFDKYTLIH